MTVTLLVTIVTLLTGALGLKNVSLVILPQAVERGLEATLLCQYDLEGEPLYAVKWYRGVREFYRYSPNDNPPSKIFPYDGINVDVSMSNASQVVLSKVGFNLSGNLSCEVTTDSPFFKTAMVSNELMVIELPKRPPSILTEKERYDVGDMMRGNCTSSPSKPPAILNVYINNIAVSQTTTRYYNSGNGLQYSVLNLQVYGTCRYPVFKSSRSRPRSQDIRTSSGKSYFPQQEYEDAPVSTYTHGANTIPSETGWRNCLQVPDGGRVSLLKPVIPWEMTGNIVKKPYM